MQPADYRTNAMPAVLAELAARGRALRDRTGRDPHAMRAPDEISDPRAGVIDEIAAGHADAMDHVLASPWYYRRRGRLLLAYALSPTLFLFSALVVVALLVTTAFAVVADRFGRWIVLLTPFSVVAVALVVSVVMHVRNQPRRWLASSPLRAEGYLELLGREERVVRVRAVIRFARGASPDIEFFKDVLAGAGIASQGVASVQPGAIAVHSPEIHGERAALHGWFQSLCSAALEPLSESYPVAVVAVEER